MNIFMKKWIVLNPILYILIIVWATLLLQLSNSARFAYSIVESVNNSPPSPTLKSKPLSFDCSQWECTPEYMTSIDLEDYRPYPLNCSYYWGCINLVYAGNQGKMETILMIVLLILITQIAFTRGIDLIILLLSTVIWYGAYFWAKISDWFYECQDFCWLESAFIFPPALTLVFIISFIVSFMKNKKSVKNG